MTEKLSESGHWYDHTGESKYTIVGKNGKERPTTLRDARKHCYVPSVTGIIAMASAPGLVNWQINEAIQAALTLEKTEDESEAQFLYRVKTEAKAKGMKAAERGTEIHAEIERGFQGKDSDTYLAVKKHINAIFPYETWIAEGSFCHESGYGGKIDLYSMNGIFIDFKTKDNLEGKKASGLVFPNHGMQLSSYAQGLDIENPIRMSIFIDRSNTELIVSHVWEADSHKKHLAMFNNLLHYWQLLKDFYPTKQLIKLKKENKK